MVLFIIKKMKNLFTNLLFVKNYYKICVIYNKNKNKVI